MDRVIMHIVGNRPQFIKLAPISREIRRRGYSEIIIHTGQHYDENMSSVFFDELDIPEPNENLNISGGSHGQMTARIMMALEPRVAKYNPGCVIIYGDTNSTLAAALVVRKLNIPIVHIEAGVRTGISDNPEEVNRILADHISNLLCAPDQKAVCNLEKENLRANTFFTGDVMYDTFLYYKDKVDTKQILSLYNLKRRKYILMTWHRQENTSDAERMQQIIDMLEMIEYSIICPLHPRTRLKLEEYGLLDRIMQLENVKLIPPVGYMEMLALELNCSMILTDSGGLSKESFFAGVKCLFMLDAEVWPDLEKIGWIIHTSNDNRETVGRIKQLLNVSATVKECNPRFYGDGSAAVTIVDLIEEHLM